MEDLIQNIKLFRPEREFAERNESIKALVLRVYRKSQSPHSVSTYINNLRRFFEWLGMEPDQAKGFKYDWTAKVNEYIDELVARGVAPKSIHNSIVSIKKWAMVNGVQVDWNNVDLPQLWRATEERMFTKEDLRSILKGGDLTDKVMVTCLLSSGLRIGTLLKLRLQDIDFRYDCPLVKVRPGIAKMRQEHITFLSPEAKEFIKLYLKERERCGERITPESYLIVRERPLGLPITIYAAEERWVNLLARTGKNTKLGKRYPLRLHGLRKYFKSWMSLSGVNRDLIEYFLGHRSTIAQTYYLPNLSSVSDPTIIEKVLAEYRKGLPAIMIFSDQEKIKELESKIEEQKRQFEEDKRRYEEEKRRLEEERKFLEERVKRLERMVEQMMALRKRMIAEQGN